MGLAHIEFRELFFGEFHLATRQRLTQERRTRVVLDLLSMLWLAHTIGLHEVLLFELLPVQTNDRGGWPEPRRACKDEVVWADVVGQLSKLLELVNLELDLAAPQRLAQLAALELPPLRRPVDVSRRS